MTKFSFDRYGYIKHPTLYQMARKRHLARLEHIDLTGALLRSKKRKLTQVTYSVQKAKDAEDNYVLPFTLDDLIKALTSIRDEYKAGKAKVEFSDLLSLRAVHLNLNGRKTVILADVYGVDDNASPGDSGYAPCIFR